MSKARHARRTASHAVLFVAALVLLGGVALAPQASACSLSSHCYGLADYSVPDDSTSGFHGATVDIRTDCFVLSDTFNNFIDDEEWIEESQGAYWTEAGDTIGNPIGPSWRYFWADNTPTGGYHQHFALNGPAAGSYFKANIHFAGGTSWNVAVAGFTGVKRKLRAL